MKINFSVEQLVFYFSLFLTVVFLATFIKTHLFSILYAEYIYFDNIPLS